MVEKFAHSVSCEAPGVAGEDQRSGRHWGSTVNSSVTHGPWSLHDPAVPGCICMGRLSQELRKLGKRMGIARMGRGRTAPSSLSVAMLPLVSGGTAVPYI